MAQPFRVIAAGHLADVSLKSPSFTTQKRDETYTSVWSRPNVPLLIFRNHSLLGRTVSYYGGALAGAAGGHPLQLVFWGNWWNSPAGAAKRSALIDRSQALLASPYFSQLDQYGVPHAPTWRGAITVTGPAPPASVQSYNDISYSVLDLIDDLIDDDVFPDPDDGPRIIFIVLMPDGFTIVNRDALGAHWKSYDNNFPWLDADTYWAGWTSPLPVDPAAPNPDFSMMSVISHEVVEILTDPEGTGWHTEATGAANEISDAGFSPGVTQSAFVNGVHVQAYWSNRHNATIIPIDRDYGAQLRARITQEGRRSAQAGVFRPDAADSAACPQYRECCFEGRDYAWRVDAIDEVARVRLETTRYREPSAAWSINSTAVAGSGQLAINLDVESYAGRTASVTNRPVTLNFVARADGIDVWAPGVQGNFSISVGCSVRDLSITGDLLVDVIATPQIELGFMGADLLLEDAYINQKSACFTAMLRRYLVKYRTPLGKIKPEEGINWDSGQLLRDLPAYVRVSHYQRLMQIANVLRAAHATLDAGDARRFASTLMEEAMVLARSANFSLPTSRRTLLAREPSRHTVSSRMQENDAGGQSTGA